ncbi:MAG: hypothetical protein ACHP7J_05615 [Terriglobales bacterium]
MKKQIAVGMLACLFLLGTAVAAKDAPKIPRTLANARYVYVTAYDGDEFNPELLPEDRAAINTVQDVIRQWGKLTLVYRPEEADVILMVESRPSEDVLAVYDADMPQTYLWRAMGRSGLQKGETPLFSEFEKAWKQMTN